MMQLVSCRRVSYRGPLGVSRKSKLFTKQDNAEICFWFGTTVEEVTKGDSLTVRLRTSSGEETIPSVRAVILATGIPVAPLADLPSKERVHRVGWAASGGKGRIVDAFAQADAVADEILQEFVNKHQR